MAGLRVTSGSLMTTKPNMFRVIRNGEEVAKDLAKGHLQIFKDPVKEVQQCHEFADFSVMVCTNVIYR